MRERERYGEREIRVRDYHESHSIFVIFGLLCRHLECDPNPCSGLALLAEFAHGREASAAFASAFARRLAAHAVDATTHSALFFDDSDEDCDDVDNGSNVSEKKLGLELDPAIVADAHASQQLSVCTLTESMYPMANPKLFALRTLSASASASASAASSKVEASASASASGSAVLASTAVTAFVATGSDPTAAASIRLPPSLQRACDLYGAQFSARFDGVRGPPKKLRWALNDGCAVLTMHGSGSGSDSGSGSYDVLCSTAHMLVLHALGSSGGALTIDEIMVQVSGGISAPPPLSHRHASVSSSSASDASAAVRDLVTDALRDLCAARHPLVERTDSGAYRLSDWHPSSSSSSLPSPQVVVIHRVRIADAAHSSGIEATKQTTSENDEDAEAVADVRNLTWRRQQSDLGEFLSAHGSGGSDDADDDDADAGGNASISGRGDDGLTMASRMDRVADSIMTQNLTSAAAGTTAASAASDQKDGQDAPLPPAAPILQVSYSDDVVTSASASASMLALAEMQRLRHGWSEMHSAISTNHGEYFKLSDMFIARDQHSRVEFHQQSIFLPCLQANL